MLKLAQLSNEFENEEGSGGGVEIADWHAPENDFSSHAAPEVVHEASDESGGAPAFDYEKFAETLGRTLQPVMRQPEREPEMTDEEFRKLTHYYAIAPEQVADFADMIGVRLDETKSAKMQAFLQQLVDGSSKHAISLAALKQQAMQRQIEGTLSPILNEKKQQAFNGFVGSLVKSSPQLKTMKGGTKLVETAIKTLQAQGYQSQGDEIDKQVILKQAEQIIQSVGGANISLASNGAGANRASGLASSVNGGGGSGGSGGGGGRKRLTPAQALYAKA